MRRREAPRLYEIGDIHGRADILAEIHRLVREDVTHGPEEIKNTVVRFGCLVDRSPPFALDSRDAPANAFSKFLAIATVIALGLAFSPQVSASHKTGSHKNVAPGNTGSPPHGCFTSPTTTAPKKCKLE